MKTVLVTGGAGFIGSHVADHLLQAGYQVICVDNFDDLYDKRIKRRNIAGQLQHKNYTLLNKDIRDRAEMERIFKKYRFHKVLHFAARAGVRASLDNPGLYEEVNVGGTINILECIRKYGAGGLIYASSSSIYGDSGETPFSESEKADSPVSPYAASKKAGELFCHTYHALYKIPVVCLRFFTVYGPRQRPEMAIHYFTRAIHQGKEITLYGDGTTRRDYTYIDDIVSGIIAAAGHEFNFDVINLGNSNTVELKYLVSLIENNVGKKAKIKWLPEQPGDVQATFADISRAKKLIGYRPETNIKSGIEKFVKWYLTVAR